MSTERQLKTDRAILQLLLAGTFLLAAAVAHADSFDWRSVGGQDFVTSVKNQGTGGTCWAFGTVGALEAKYMLTRNDSSFQPDVSEQNLVCASVGGAIYGGWACDAVDYFTSTGIVSEAELPYTAQDTSSLWPLKAGWRTACGRALPTSPPFSQSCPADRHRQYQGGAEGIRSPACHHLSR